MQYQLEARKDPKELEIALENFIRMAKFFAQPIDNACCACDIPVILDCILDLNTHLHKYQKILQAAGYRATHEYTKI